MKSKTENSLIPFNTLPAFNLPARAELDKGCAESRDKLLIRSKGLSPVTDLQSCSLVTEVGVEIRRAVKLANERFDELNRPLIDGRKLLKSILDEYCVPLLSEQMRLERQVTLWRRQEEERVEAERKKQQEESERLQREVDERQRKADEAAAKAKGPRSMDKALDLQTQANQARENLIVQQTAPLPQVQTARGSSYQKKLKIEVSNIALVYQHNPHLVNLELKLSVVKGIYDPPKTFTRNAPDTSVPGLLMFWEDDTSFRG